MLVFSVKSVCEDRKEEHIPPRKNAFFVVNGLTCAGRRPYFISVPPTSVPEPLNGGLK